MTEQDIQPSFSLSRTAVWVAASRAVGAKEPDMDARNPDFLAGRLLGDLSDLDFEHPIVDAINIDYDEAMQDLEVVTSVCRMTVRTRFIDETLERAIADGAAQVVILGAGYDSHAYRFQDQLNNARVFEVDRPAMQSLKRQRVDDALGGPPTNLTYVAIDFQHEDLPEVMARHRYDPALRTFFIMEGVTMYLPEEALRQTLQFVASHPPGSAIVFDFVYQAMIDMFNKADTKNANPMAKRIMQRFQDMIRDEPWIFGFPLEREREYLGEFGLELREVLQVNGEEANRRYLTRANGSIVGAEVYAAFMARMMERAREAKQAGVEGIDMSPERMREMQRLTAYLLAEAVVR